MRTGAVAIAVLALSCGQPATKEAPSNVVQPADIAQSQTPPIPPPGTGPDARTPLAEPNNAIDPKSVEAAGQVVQHYGALIEQDRFAEAEKLWTGPEPAAAFSKDLRPRTHLAIGELGETEGAAGSIYVTVSVVFYKDSWRKPASIILRRVNDVPGSSAAERRWHIQRIEWKGSI